MLGNLGTYELSAGDLDAARSHVAESLEIAHALNASSDIVYQALNLGLAEYLGGLPGAAEALFAEALDVAQRMGMKAGMAYALIGLAMSGRGRAGPCWSARLHGAADQALADLGHALEPLEARLADADRQRLRAEMGEAAFEADYAAGRALDLARAADQARQGIRAGREAPRAGAPESEPGTAGSGAAVSVLTPRELDVVKLVALGLSNPDIARRLFLSEHTVHRHLANILRKLNLSSRASAAAWGVRTGLV
jgi:DNA-binding CsgD family transcriptional regulator